MHKPVMESQPPEWDSGTPSGRRAWLGIAGVVVVVVAAAVALGVAGLLPSVGSTASAVSPVGEAGGFPPTIWIGEPAELAPLFDEQVSRGRGQRGEHGSYMQFDIGHDGQLVVETGYVGQELPATVPARADLEPDRYSDSLNWPGHEVERGEIIADVAVNCVRVVVTVNDTGAPDPDATATLADTIEERVRAWLDDSDRDDVCAQGQS
jgi:hypothetical protein